MSSNVAKFQPSDQTIAVMRESLYPGASEQSVRLALSYCHARGFDPFLKPVHIVPMWVKDAATGVGGMRDILMPGIALYRIQAARTGHYAGKAEPVFGPDVTRTLGGVHVTFPQWCSVTVQRVVDGKICQFTAKEFWIENYATAKKETDAPNAMWKKRAYGQIAKVAEAQALRMAFPEETGGEPTSEEMEGKTFSGQTIDEHPTQNQQPTNKNTTKIHDVEPEKPRPDPNAAAREFAEKTIKNMDRASNADKLAAWLTDPQNTQARADIMAVSADLGNALEAAIKAACDRLGIKTDTLGQDVVSSVRLGRDIPLTPDADIPSLDESFPGDRLADNSIRNKNNGISKQQNY